jgi:hypothetical protein
LIIPFVAFIPLATMDLYCIYRELKAVQLTTINKERAEIIADHWINHGSVPGTKYVSAAERLFVPARMDESTLPLRIAGEYSYILIYVRAIRLTACFVCTQVCTRRAAGTQPRSRTRSGWLQVRAMRR